MIKKKIKQITYAICLPTLACIFLIMLLLSATVLEEKMAKSFIAVHKHVSDHTSKIITKLVNPPPSPIHLGLSTEEHLIQAAKNGNLTVVQRALHRLQIHNSHRHAVVDMALYYAAEFNHIDIVAHLLSREGVDPNEGHHEDGHTVLTVASSKGYTEIVQLLLLMRGTSININIRAKRSKTALIWSSINGHTEIVRLLTGSKRCNLELRDSHYKRTALMWATATHHTEIVEILLRAGADPHASGARNPFLKVKHIRQPHVSAMHIAKHYGHDGAIEHLENHIKARSHTVPESPEHAAELDKLRKDVLGEREEIDSSKDDEL